VCWVRFAVSLGGASKSFLKYLCRTESVWIQDEIARRYMGYFLCCRPMISFSWFRLAWFQELWKTYCAPAESSGSACGYKKDCLAFKNSLFDLWWIQWGLPCISRPAPSHDPKHLANAIDAPYTLRAPNIGSSECVRIDMSLCRSSSP